MFHRINQLHIQFKFHWIHTKNKEMKNSGLKTRYHLLCDAEMEEKAIVVRSIGIIVNRAIVVILVPTV